VQSFNSQQFSPDLPYIDPFSSNNDEKEAITVYAINQETLAPIENVDY
jgi:hypothetical protein